MKNIEIVQELKPEYQTYEEFMRNYQGDTNYADLNHNDIREVRGYGPHPDIWNESDSAHAFDSGFEALSVSTKGRIESGANERIYASAGAELSTFRYKDDVGDLELFSYSASAEAGIGSSGASAKYKLGVDLANDKVGGVKSNLGVDVGSEASIGERSAKLKLAGVGISIGKEIGFNTPIGGEFR